MAGSPSSRHDSNGHRGERHHVTVRASDHRSAAHRREAAAPHPGVTGRRHGAPLCRRTEPAARDSPLGSRSVGSPSARALSRRKGRVRCRRRCRRRPPRRSAGSATRRLRPEDRSAAPCTPDTARNRCRVPLHHLPMVSNLDRVAARRPDSIEPRATSHVALADGADRFRSRPARPVRRSSRYLSSAAAQCGCRAWVPSSFRRCPWLRRWGPSPR